MYICTVNFPGDEELYVDNWSEDDLTDTEIVSSDSPEEKQNSEEDHPNEDSSVSTHYMDYWVYDYFSSKIRDF